MIEETGVVTKVEDTMATVIVQKRGACDGCKARGTCETTPEGMEIRVLNPLNAGEGQSVRISMSTQTYLKGTMLVYGLPLAVFIAGAILGKNIGEEFLKDTNSDLVAAIAGFSALIISLLWVKLWSRKIESGTEYHPVIEEIIE